MINENNLSKYYHDIANKLNQIVPVDWDEIIMYGEELGDVSSACFYYKSKSDLTYKYSGSIPTAYPSNIDVFFKLLRDLININKSLWQEFFDANVQTWKTITFRLERNNHFKIKFSYDINSNISDYERKIRWAYDELSIIPEDVFPKKILEEYLLEKNK